MVTAVHQWRRVPVIFGHRFREIVSKSFEGRWIFLTAVQQSDLGQLVVFDPSLNRSKCGQILQAIMSFLALFLSVLFGLSWNSSTCRHLQAIPNFWEKQSHFLVITWSILPFGSTALLRYREAVFSLRCREYRIPAGGRRRLVLPTPKHEKRTQQIKMYALAWHLRSHPE